MRKKSIAIISLVLSLLMVMSVFSVITVSAEVVSGEDTANNITWSFDTDTKTLTINGSGDYPDYTYHNLEPWFQYAGDAETLILGEGFTSIADMAFQTVYSELETLKLPDSLKTIGKGAFDGADQLFSVDFGSGVETIGSGAFGGCDFYEISIPSNVKTIEGGAFYDNKNLSQVTFAEGLETIGALAFADTALKSVTIPDSVTSIGKQAFGYYYDEPYDDDGTTSLFGMYPVDFFEIHASASNAAAAKYAKDNKFTLCTGAASISPKSVSLKAGATKKITVKNAAVTGWSTPNKKIALVKNGTVYALKKGSATITAKTLQGKKLTCKVKVTTNPTIKVNGKKFKASTRYTVKKGKTIKVTITGKSSKVKNVYSSTKKKIAKVISKNTAKTVKIKGLKKVGATVTIKVNGVAFKVKVKVK